MTRMIVPPSQLDLESPGRRDYWVSLEHDSIWGEHLIPLTVLVGPQAKPGQGLVAFGSNHGNEYEGPVVVKKLLREMKAEEVLGRIILVPVLNVAAFRAGTRESTADDRVNLNRAFVDQAGKVPSLAGITHRIAAFVRDHIWPQVHVVIDLHSGGEVARFAPCVNFHPVDNPARGRQIEEAARWFGAPLVMVYQNRTPGLLPSEAENLGKITLGTELGWGSAVNAEGVRYGRQGVLAAAIHHGQLRGQLQPIGHHAAGTQRKVEIVDRECFVPAPFPGLYEPLLECGATVKRGQVVGLLHDFCRIDEEPHPVRAGVDGIALAQAWRARVEQGQHILVVGQERAWLTP
ncbi:MAG: succinylglutamate desuccinylase/aspartoacylase family protein [Candidatus Latescibacteria bacterium]|nr:succinylglutamate desuccinylase/aspartoacylase family protein [Candidatus Latescibacterota bacterium]